MISINTHFHPFRMGLAKKEPVQLTVDIKNTGSKDAILTLVVALTRELSLDRSGIVNNATKRIERLGPGESKLFYFDIYPKAMTRKGEAPVLVKVIEHYRDFGFVQQEHTKRLTIKVEE